MCACPLCSSAIGPTGRTTPTRTPWTRSTTLRRVGVLATASAVWLATAGDEEAMRLLPLVTYSPDQNSADRLRRGRGFLHVFTSTANVDAAVKTEPTPEQRAKAQKHIRQLFFTAQMYRRAIESLEQLMTPQGIQDFRHMVGTPETPPVVVLGPDATRPVSKRRVPKKKYIGPIADGPSSPGFRQALGTDYAWWHEQSLRFPPSDLIPRFELIVYEAGNFADGKRTLAEIEDVVAAEYGELPEGLIEGVFDRLAKIGLVEWVEE